MQLKFSWGVGKDMESVARMRDAYRTDVYIHPLDITKVPFPNHLESKLADADQT